MYDAAAAAAAAASHDARMPASHATQSLTAGISRRVNIAREQFDVCRPWCRGQCGGRNVLLVQQLLAAAIRACTSDVGRVFYHSAGQCSSTQATQNNQPSGI